MSWSVANGKYLCYTLSSLAAVRRGDGLQLMMNSKGLPSEEFADYTFVF
jgi:hypothetical protein